MIIIINQKDYLMLVSLIELIIDIMIQEMMNIMTTDQIMSELKAVKMNLKFLQLMMKKEFLLKTQGVLNQESPLKLEIFYPIVTCKKRKNLDIKILGPEISKDQD